MILREFQVKAPLHMDVSRLPVDQKFSWLSEAQHHGIPTRLLDFTYSPFVALYFALRGQPEHCESRPAALWPINAQSVLDAAQRVVLEADREQTI